MQMTSETGGSSSLKKAQGACHQEMGSDISRPSSTLKQDCSHTPKGRGKPKSTEITGMKGYDKKVPSGDSNDMEAMSSDDTFHSLESDDDSDTGKNTSRSFTLCNDTHLENTGNSNNPHVTGSTSEIQTSEDHLHSDHQEQDMVHNSAESSSIEPRKRSDSCSTASGRDVPRRTAGLIAALKIGDEGNSGNPHVTESTSEIQISEDDLHHDHQEQDMVHNSAENSSIEPVRKRSAANSPHQELKRQQKCAVNAEKLLKKVQYSDENAENDVSHTEESNSENDLHNNTSGIPVATEVSIQCCECSIQLKKLSVGPSVRSVHLTASVLRIIPSDSLRQDRGRARKNRGPVGSAALPEKNSSHRGRGRPRKNTEPVNAVAANLEKELPHQSRGKPRKNTERMSAAASPQKDLPRRGRGRPRKNAASMSTATSPEKDSPHRVENPEKNAGFVDAEASPEKDLPHQAESPAKNAGSVDAASTSKKDLPRRGRGRPPKIARHSTDSAPPEKDLPRRGRGGPRKNAGSLDAVAPPEKKNTPSRGRGRPRKNIVFKETASPPEKAGEEIGEKKQSDEEYLNTTGSSSSSKSSSATSNSNRTEDVPSSGTDLNYEPSDGNSFVQENSVVSSSSDHEYEPCDEVEGSSHVSTSGTDDKSSDSSSIRISKSAKRRSVKRISSLDSDSGSNPSENDVEVPKSGSGPITLHKRIRSRKRRNKSSTASRATFSTSNRDDDALCALVGISPCKVLCEKLNVHS